MSGRKCVVGLVAVATVGSLGSGCASTATDLEPVRASPAAAVGDAVGVGIQFRILGRPSELKRKRALNTLRSLPGGRETVRLIRIDRGNVSFRDGSTSPQPAIRVVQAEQKRLGELRLISYLDPTGQRLLDRRVAIVGEDPDAVGTASIELGWN